VNKLAISLNAAISAEFTEKRRRAEQEARRFKAEVYEKVPMLYDIEKRINNTATEYTKRMIGGEDVRAEMNEKLALLFGEKEALLELNGFNSEDFKPKYQCTLCNDKGFTADGMCSCFRNRVIEENFKNSNIGDSLSHQSFESFRFDLYPEQKIGDYPRSPKDNMVRNFNRCKGFAEDFDNVSKSLLLVGGTGLGKTFLSTCIAKYLLQYRRGNQI
jgi:DNA replication protein DnaC